MTPLRSNPVVHLELHTGDLPQARDLYAELCGWCPEWIETRAGSLDNDRFFDASQFQANGPLERGTGADLDFAQPVRRESWDRAASNRSSSALKRSKLPITVSMRPRPSPLPWTAAMPA